MYSNFVNELESNLNFIATLKINVFQMSEVSKTDSSHMTCPSTSKIVYYVYALSRYRCMKIQMCENGVFLVPVKCTLVCNNCAWLYDTPLCVLIMIIQYQILHTVAYNISKQFLGTAPKHDVQYWNWAFFQKSCTVTTSCHTKYLWTI